MPGEVDLHGLFVKEAIAYTDQNIAEARARGDKEIRLIVGSSKSFLYFEGRERIDRLALAPFCVHRQGHPLSESRGKAQTSH
jgi:hypothetical protein